MAVHYVLSDLVRNSEYKFSYNAVNIAFALEQICFGTKIGRNRLYCLNNIYFNSTESSLKAWMLASVILHGGEKQWKGKTTNILRATTTLPLAYTCIPMLAVGVTSKCFTIANLPLLCASWKYLYRIYIWAALRTKNVFGVSNQVPQKLGCAATEVLNACNFEF